MSNVLKTEERIRLCLVSEAIGRGPICADFDEDCADWTSEQYARCAKIYDAGPCPYLKSS